jgi:hypothetical protein
MKYLTHLVTAGIFFYLGFMFKSCSTEPCPEIKEGIETRIDTVFLQTEVTKKPYKPTGKKLPADTSTSADLDKAAVYVYQDSLSDSNLTFYITDTTAGEILSRALSYKLKVPLQIKETTTITKVLQVPVPQSGVFFGMEAGCSIPLKNYRLAPEIEYLSKKGYAYSYNYDLINKVHSAGIKKRIF